WENLQTTALQNRLSTLARAALRSMVDREAWDAVQSASLVRERARGQNAALVEAELCDERHFFDSIENTPLTDEQARAVICSDNRVLLVASAGSGKTSTIIARAGWTV